MASDSNSNIHTIHRVSLLQPLLWLVAGWRDLLRAGWISILHGLAMALGGALIFGIAHQRFWLLAGAFSGFMVVAPVLATSLYALSRALERREKADYSVVLNTWLDWKHSHINIWSPDYWCMVRFGVLLTCAATGWVITSAALITLLAAQPIVTPLDFLHHVVLARDGWLFEVWLALGGMLAAPMFASSVVAMPLLLDRRVGVLEAILCSWKVVLANPLPMALWAALILLCTLIGMGTLLCGLILIVPILGHASWHAYRDLVNPSQWEAREGLSAPDSRFGGK